MKKILPMKHGLRGEIEIPGDKSISHRAIMLSSLGSSTVEIENFLFGADCLSTVDCMKKLGAKIEICGEKIFVTGNGLHGLKEPEGRRKLWHDFKTFVRFDCSAKFFCDIYRRRVIKTKTNGASYKTSGRNGRENLRAQLQ